MSLPEDLISKPKGQRGGWSVFKDLRPSISLGAKEGKEEYCNHKVDQDLSQKCGRRVYRITHELSREEPFKSSNGGGGVGRKKISLTTGRK